MGDKAEYEVVIANTALKEAEEYATFILEQSHDRIASDQWWDGLLDAVFSLEALPSRCPYIPEKDGQGFGVPQLLYESHRILFVVQPKTVHILRIVHSSRKPITTNALMKALRGSRTSPKLLN